LAQIQSNTKDFHETSAKDSKDTTTTSNDAKTSTKRIPEGERSQRQSQSNEEFKSLQPERPINGPEHEDEMLRPHDMSLMSMDSISTAGENLQHVLTKHISPAGSEKSIVALRKEVQGLRANARSLGKEEDDLRMMIQNKEAEIDLQAEELSSLNAKLSRIQGGLSGIEEERKLLKEKVGILETVKKQLTDKLANREGEIQNLGRRLQLHTDKAAESEIVSNDGELKQVEEVLSRCVRERDLLVDELNRVTRDRDAVAGNLSSCLVNLNLLGEEKKLWERERQDLIGQSDRALKQARIRHQKNINELNNQLYQQNSQVRLLQVKLEEVCDNLPSEDLLNQIAAYKDAQDSNDIAHSNELDMMRSSLEEKQSLVDELVSKVESLGKEVLKNQHEHKNVIADKTHKHEEEMNRLTLEYEEQLEAVKGAKEEQESLTRALEFEVHELHRSKEECNKKAEERMASLGTNFGERLRTLQEEALQAIAELRAKLEEKHKLVSVLEQEIKTLQNKMTLMVEAHQKEIIQMKDARGSSGLYLNTNQQDTFASLKEELEEKSSLIQSFEKKVSQLKSDQARFQFARSQSDDRYDEEIRTLQTQLVNKDKQVASQQQEIESLRKQESDRSDRERKDEDLEYQLDKWRGLLDLARNDHNQAVLEIKTKYETQVRLLEESQTKQITSLKHELHLKDKTIRRLKNSSASSAENEPDSRKGGRIDGGAVPQASTPDNGSSLQQELQKALLVLREKEVELDRVKSDLLDAERQNAFMSGELRSTTVDTSSMEAKLSKSQEALRVTKDQHSQSGKKVSLLPEEHGKMHKSQEQKDQVSTEKILQLSQSRDALQIDSDHLEQSNGNLEASTVDFADSLAREKHKYSIQHTMLIEKEELMKQLQQQISGGRKNQSDTEELQLPESEQECTHWTDHRMEKHEVRQSLDEKTEMVKTLETKLGEKPEPNKRSNRDQPKSHAPTMENKGRAFHEKEFAREMMEGERRCSNQLLWCSRKIHLLNSQIAQKDRSTCSLEAKLLQHTQRNLELSKIMEHVELQMQELCRSAEDKNTQLKIENEKALLNQRDNLMTQIKLMRATIQEKDSLLDGFVPANKHALLLDKHEKTTNELNVQSKKCSDLQQLMKERARSYEQKLVELEEQLAEQDSIIAALEIELERNMECLMNANRPLDLINEDEVEDEMLPASQLRVVGDQLLDRDTAIAHLEAEIIRLEMENQFLEQDQASTELPQLEIIRVTADLESQKVLVTELEKELLAVKQDRDSLLNKESQIKLATKLEVENLQHQCDELQEKLRAAGDESKLKDAAVSELEVKLCSRDGHVNALYSELESVKGTLSEAREKTANYCANNGEMALRITSLEWKLEHTEGLLDQRTSKIRECTRQVTGIRRTISDPDSVADEDDISKALICLYKDCKELKSALDRLHLLSDPQKGNEKPGRDLHSASSNLHSEINQGPRGVEFNEECNSGDDLALEAYESNKMKVRDNFKTLHPLVTQIGSESQSSTVVALVTPPAKTTWDLALEEEFNLAGEEDLLLDLQ